MVSYFFLEFSPRNLGEDGSSLTIIFFNWVEGNHQLGFFSFESFLCVSWVYPGYVFVKNFQVFQFGLRF